MVVSNGGFVADMRNYWVHATGRYYFPGLYTAILPMVPGIWAISRLIRATDKQCILDKKYCRWHVRPCHRLPALEVVRQPDAAAALLDPVRQRLLAELAEPDSASGLARRLRLPRQRINYHLRALESAGLVELVEERRKGNCIGARRAGHRARVRHQPGSAGAARPHRRDRAGPVQRRLPHRRGGAAIRDVGALEARARNEQKRLATLTLEADIRFRHRRITRGVRRGAG